MAAESLARDLSGKNALITGGAGFVGSNLADAIVDYLDHLVILDNMATGSLENVENLLDNNREKVTLMQKDVRSYEDCLKATKDVDVIFHLAAQINPTKAVDDPIYDFEVNARGTLNILEAARKNRVTKLVYASTNVYGNPKYLPIDEDHPMDLLSPYAASKLAGEAYAIVYHNTYGVKTVRLRLSNIYGPRQTTKSGSGAVAIFTERVLRGQPPIIFGDGDQTRDFVYVTDVVKALIKASVVPGAEGEVFNIGSGVETTIKDLARAILKITKELVGKEPDTKLLHSPQRSADFRRAQIDISKANKTLGYSPAIMFEEGLRETVKWHLLSATT